MIRSFVATSILFLILTLFETAIFSNILVLPSSPDFLLIVLLYVAVQNGRLFGVVVGFISGLLLDFFTGSPFGLHCLLRTMLGYVAGLVNKSLNLSGILLPALQGLSASVLKIMLLLVISFLFPAGIKGYTLFSFSRLFELACNTILTPAIFAFLALFDRYLVADVEKVL